MYLKLAGNLTLMHAGIHAERFCVARKDIDAIVENDSETGQKRRCNWTNTNFLVTISTGISKRLDGLT